MNAITYIQQHGVEKAREVVEGAIYPIFGYDPVGMNYIHKQCDIAPVRYSPNCNSWSEDYAIETILIDDLKRLVESVDLVTAWGGTKEIKNLLNSGVYGIRIKEALEDYEQIFGGEHV